MAGEQAFLRQHGRHLPFGGAVNARIGPALFPAIEIGLRLFQSLEAQSFEWSLLGVTNARLHFTLAIGVSYPARQGDSAVVLKQIPVQRVECGIVNVRRQHAFAQIIQLLWRTPLCGAGSREGANSRRSARMQEHNS